MTSWLYAVMLAASPTLVNAPVEKVFVPVGFDDNDNAEIILHGNFPSTCYKTGPVQTVVDEATHSIKINAQAYQYTSIGCAAMMVPFTQSVKLSTLAQGSYTITVEAHPELESPQLTVSQARSADPDDYLYAPVEQVKLEATSSGGHTVTLSGEYPYMFVGCMIMDHVKSYVAPGGTLVVLPIARLATDAECDTAQYDHNYSITAEVTEAMPSDQYLVHVRTLNGTSLNRFTDLTP